MYTQCRRHQHSNAEKLMVRKHAVNLSELHQARASPGQTNEGVCATTPNRKNRGKNELSEGTSNGISISMSVTRARTDFYFSGYPVIVQGA